MLTDNEPFPFLPGQYDLIVVPGTKLQVPYAPADHNCGDSHGLLAGNFRVLGAVARHMIELRQLSAFGIDGGPQLTPILFTGGQTKPVNGELDDTTPTEAEVFKTAFQKTFQLVCAIDPEVKAASQQYGRLVLLTEMVSDTTATGAAAALEIAREAGMRRVEFITNIYHEPRSRIRVDSIATEADSNVVTTHSVAEDYAEHVFGQPFRNMMLKAYSSEVGCRRLQYEALGMAALFDGQYNMPGYRPEVDMDKQVGLIAFLLSRIVLEHADYPRGKVGSYEQAMLQLLTSQSGDDVTLAYDPYNRADDVELERRAYEPYDEALDEYFDMY